MTLNSKHFSLQELQRSRSADDLKIDNRLPQELLPNLQRLCTEVLDPLRDALGVPLLVSSGYRSPRLNRAIGGSDTSAHLLALAADLYLRPGCHADNARIAAAWLALALPFDQLICERIPYPLRPAKPSPAKPSPAKNAPENAPENAADSLVPCRWVHLALAPEGRPLRLQVLRTDALGRYR